LQSGSIFNIARYAIHDGPGIRTTVFFKGCPLDCLWCHNPESIAPETQIALYQNRCIRCGRCVEACPNGAIELLPAGADTDMSLCRLCLKCAQVCSAEAREAVGRAMTVEQVMTEIERDIPFYDESGGGATFSGGEPLLQSAFLLELLEACARAGIHRAVDTSGHADRAVILEVARKTDLFLYDLKHMDSEVHRKYTGAGNERILENLELLAAAGAAIRVRFPLIPGINDDRDNVEKTGAFLQKLQRVDGIDILPYHDALHTKYRRFRWPWRLDTNPVPDLERMKIAAAILRSYALPVALKGIDHE
jgi:pyruvate formate lyase activating enzyme